MASLPNRVTRFFLLLAMFLMVAWFAQAGDEQETGQPRFLPVPVAFERLPGLNQRAVLEVRIGPLKAGESLVVADEDGRILGAAAPFGVTARSKSGAYILPYPEDLMKLRETTLRVSIKTAGEEKPRAPDKKEFLSIRAFIQ